MAIMSKLQSAYLAGLIDGEGYIGIMKIKKTNKNVHSRMEYLYVIVLKITMCDEELIKHLHSSFGGGYHKRVLSKKNKNWKDSYCWTLTNAKCMDILNLTYPYMRSKREEVEILREYQKTNKGAGYPLSDESWQIRDQLYERIRKLHYRGNGSLRD